MQTFVKRYNVKFVSKTRAKHEPTAYPPTTKNLFICYERKNKDNLSVQQLRYCCFMHYRYDVNSDNFNFMSFKHLMIC